MFRRRLPPLEYDSAPQAQMARQAFPGLENAPPVGPGMAAPPRQGLFGRARNWLSQPNEQGLTGADRLYAIGGALKDLDWTSGGGHFDAAMQQQEQQRAQYEQEQARRQYAEAMQQIFADGRVDPQELGGLPGATFSDYMALQERNEPRLFQYQGQIAAVGPDGQASVVHDFPDGFADLEREKLEAEIEAIRALRQQRIASANRPSAAAPVQAAPRAAAPAPWERNW